MPAHTYNLGKLEQALESNSPVKLTTLGAELSINEWPLLRRAILRSVRWQHRRCQLVQLLQCLMGIACLLLIGVAVIGCLAAAI